MIYADSIKHEFILEQSRQLRWFLMFTYGAVLLLALCAPISLWLKGVIALLCFFEIVRKELDFKNSSGLHGFSAIAHHEGQWTLRHRRWSDGGGTELPVTLISYQALSIGLAIHWQPFYPPVGWNDFGQWIKKCRTALGCKPMLKQIIIKDQLPQGQYRWLKVLLMTAETSGKT